MNSYQKAWEQGFDTGYQKGFDMGFTGGKEDVRFTNVRRSKGMKRNWEVLKRMDKLESKIDRLQKNTSYTCCNIEVNEPAGTEVMCSECKEWITTK